MGWIIALLLASASFAACYFSRRCSRQMLELVAAALVIALAGYGWQGSPAMEGHPVKRGDAVQRR